MRKNRSSISTLSDNKLEKFKEIILLIIIKTFYDYQTVMYLKDAWYASVYGGYDINFSFEKFLLASSIFLILCSIYLFIKIDGYFLKTLISVLFVFYYIPLNSAYYINDTSTAFMVFSSLYLGLILISLHQRGSSCQSNKLCINEKNTENSYPSDQILRSLSIFSAVICVLLIVHKLSFNGLELNLSIDSEWVYTARELYNETTLGTARTPLGYLLSFIDNTSGTASLFLIYYSLKKRKLVLGVIGLACVLSKYSLSAGKSTLFYIPIVFIIFILAKYDFVKSFNKIFYVGIIGLFIVGFIVPDVYIIVLRRTMFTPAWLSSIYFEYFSNNPLVLWTQDAVPFKWIFQSQYDVPHLELISNTYFLGRMPSPNNGLFSEAFMHFGYWGALIYPFILGIQSKWFARNFDSLGNGLSMFFAIRVGILMTNVPISRIDFILSTTLFVFLIAILKKIVHNNEKKCVSLKIHNSYCNGFNISSQTPNRGKFFMKRIEIKRNV